MASTTTIDTHTLPPFSTIKANKIEAILNDILHDNRQKIHSLSQQSEPFTWENFMAPMESLNDRLSRMWSPIAHLNAVMNSNELRNAYNACLPKLTEYYTELGHNETLYQAVQSIAKSGAYAQLDPAQKKVIEHELRDFKLSGITLPKDKKKRFAELSKELSQLTTKFEENVLDATQGWHKLITDEEQLAGLPKHAIRAAADAAKQQQKKGWVFTLEFPSYIAIMTYADSRSLREAMYYAFSTRASDQGPNAGRWDNSDIMQRILKMRLELAHLLDFNNFAEESLATKMVESTQQVLDFLNQLVTASLPKAKQEFSELETFAKEEFNLESLEAWDLAYVSEKLRQHRYAISQEELRHYFPEPNVVMGLFQIVNRLFHIDVKERNDVDTWHPDVRVYAIYNQQGQHISDFYLDLYARENKRGGAWMDECRVRRQLENGDLQNPVAYITCNLNPPVGDEPALFRHEEVVTLFHEFGHALQHMLTKINYSEVSGINGIPWDAVEVASQFLENWAWEKESISYIAQHYQTKEPLPDDLFQKLLKAKTFQSAMHTVRQLELALFDFKLHLMFDPNENNQIQTILDEVRSRVSVIPTPKYNRFQHSFSHIFAGGYAAGYYSYKWAEVMAADAFSLFKENGLFDPDTSQRFLHTFLESGGAVEPAIVFKEFRGRDPEIDALLKQDGII